MSSVKFIDIILNKFSTESVQELFKKNSKIVSMLHTFDDTKTRHELSDLGMLDVFQRKNYGLSESGEGKFQYILTKYKRKFKSDKPINGPDNNDREYKPIDYKLEKAKSKCDAYENDNIDDCMTDTTGDYEFYQDVTQRKYDLYMAWCILNMMKTFETKVDFIKYLNGLDYRGDDSEDTILKVVRDCYLGIGNSDFDL